MAAAVAARLEAAEARASQAEQRRADREARAKPTPQRSGRCEQESSAVLRILLKFVNVLATFDYFSAVSALIL